MGTPGLLRDTFSNRIMDGSGGREMKSFLIYFLAGALVAASYEAVQQHKIIVSQRKEISSLMDSGKRLMSDVRAVEAGVRLVGGPDPLKICK